MVDHEEALWRAERECLGPGLNKFLSSKFGDNWIALLRAIDEKGATSKPITRSYSRLDVQESLRFLTDSRLGASAKRELRQAIPMKFQGLAFELRAYRNELHHRQPLDLTEVVRALDSSIRLLRAVGENEYAKQVSQLLGSLVDSDKPSAIAASSAPKVQKTIEAWDKFEPQTYQILYNRYGYALRNRVLTAYPDDLIKLKHAAILIGTQRTHLISLIEAEGGKLPRFPGGPVSVATVRKVFNTHYTKHTLPNKSSASFEEIENRHPLLDSNELTLLQERIAHGLGTRPDQIDFRQLVESLGNSLDVGKQLLAVGYTPRAAFRRGREVSVPTEVIHELLAAFYSRLALPGYWD